MNSYETVGQYFRKRLFLLLVIVLFVACKIPYLHYPYFWDECWPYAPAIKAMYHHGISLMPGAIDPELSRGHPLFFHAAAAVWMNVFGGSLTAMHSFALFVSVCLLVAIYEISLRLFNMRVAIISLLGIATQMFFYVQSVLVLPEVMVALLCFLSIYLYVTERYLWTAACLSMLFLTKESGLIAGFVIGIDALVSLPDRSIAVRQRLLKIIAIGIPCALMLSFFLVQKSIRGWYVFPLHVSLIEHNLQAIWYKLRMGCIRDTFYQHLRLYDFIALLALCLIAVIRNKNYRLLTILLPAACIYYFVDDMRAGRLLPSIPFFIVYVLSISAFVYTYCRKEIFATSYQRRMITLLCFFILCFHCFSATTLYTYRYLQAAIIPTIYLFAVLADYFISQSYKVLLYPLLGVILIVNLLSYKRSTAISDVEPAAYNAMNVQQSVVNYLEHNNCYDQWISCGSFLEAEHLKDANTGFLGGERSFSKVQYEVTDQTKLIVLDNVEPDGRYEVLKKDNRFHLVYRHVSGPAWAEIYAHN